MMFIFIMDGKETMSEVATIGSEMDQKNIMGYNLTSIYFVYTIK